MLKIPADYDRDASQAKSTETLTNSFLNLYKLYHVLKE
jgi:hypothetical protein